MVFSKSQLMIQNKQKEINFRYRNTVQAKKLRNMLYLSCPACISVAEVAAGCELTAITSQIRFGSVALSCARSI